MKKLIPLSVFALIFFSAFINGEKQKLFTKIIIRVINLNTSEGDCPSISTSATGEDFEQLKLGDSLEFIIDYSKHPKLYMWTCPRGGDRNVTSGNSCIWKAYKVPAEIGKSFTKDQNNPAHRNLIIKRIKEY